MKVVALNYTAEGRHMITFIARQYVAQGSRTLLDVAEYDKKGLIPHNSIIHKCNTA